MFKDQLFHNQIRDGVELLLRKERELTHSGESTLFNRGALFTVGKVYQNPYDNLFVLVQSEEKQYQLPIDHTVELFDRVVPEEELPHNGWATPFITDKDYSGDMIEIYDDEYIEAMDDEYFDKLEEHTKEQELNEFINDLTNKDKKD